MSVSYSFSVLLVPFYICTFAKTLNIMMKVSNEIISHLKKHQSSTPSKWRENAEWRMANKSWLRYSQHIAMLMLDRMEELDITQKQLSELMGCTNSTFPKSSKDRKNCLSKLSPKSKPVFRYTFCHELPLRQSPRFQS